MAIDRKRLVYEVPKEATQKEKQMGAKEYQEVYPHMTDDEKNLMYELWMTGVNRDGHAWVTYGDVERAVGLILKGRISNG